MTRTRAPAVGSRAVLEMLRLPAALTVPGDVAAGAAFAGSHFPARRAAGLMVSSTCLYLGGMALNDYADRDVDALERPDRPIPSGRVRPGTALVVAAALTAVAAALARAAGGWRATAVTVSLAGVVWSYDLGLKHTGLGPATMAAARFLDVLVGASGGRMRHALPAAAAVGAHTLMITMVSRHEADGAGAGLPAGALVGTAAISALTGVTLHHNAPRNSGPALALLAAKAAVVAAAEARAILHPGPASLQRVVAEGILAMLPLQGALLAGCGHRRSAALAALTWPLARRLGRRVSPT